MHHVPKRNWFCEWKENGQNKYPIFPQLPNSEHERKEKPEMELSVISPHLISHRKEPPRGFGENHFKAFSKKAVYVPLGSVFSLTLPSYPLINISLDHGQLCLLDTAPSPRDRG